MKTNKLRIKLRAYDYNILDASVQEIVQTAKNTGARVAGPIPYLLKLINIPYFGHHTSIKNLANSSK